MYLSSGNCKAGLFGPSRTAVGQFSWRALWKSAVVGREERLSSSRSEALSVAPPKLLVFDSALLAVSSVYGNILLPAVISFWDKEHAYTLMKPYLSLNCSTSFGAMWCKSIPRIKLNLAGGFFKQLWPWEHASALSKLYFLANFSLQVRMFLFNL